MKKNAQNLSAPSGLNTSWAWRVWNGAGAKNLRCVECNGALDLSGLKAEAVARCGRCGHVFEVPGAPSPSTTMAGNRQNRAGSSHSNMASKNTNHTNAATMPVSVSKESILTLHGTRIPEQISAYVIESELGRGGMAVVYRGRHATLAKPVAIKLLLPGMESSGELGVRFEREALALAKFRHPNIVPVLDAGTTEDGIQYLVMDLIEGENLAQKLRRDGRLEWRPAFEILAQLAEGIDFAHTQGIIHRDLKPANVLLEDGGQTKIVDFGLARDEEDGSSLTQSGTALGTPAYMPPEQARGDRSKVDRRSDIYSLGAILYELLTGFAPFQGETAMKILYKVLEEDPKPIRSLAPEVSMEVVAVCLKAMDKDPERRYLSAFQMLQDIRACLNDEKPPVAMAAGNTPLRRWVRKQRLWGWRGMAGAALVVLFMGWGLARNRASELRQQRRDDANTQIDAGLEFIVNGKLVLADAAFLKAQELEPGNVAAQKGRRKVTKLQEVEKEIKRKEELARIKRELAKELAGFEPTQLKEIFKGGSKNALDWLNGFFDEMNPLSDKADANTQAEAEGIKNSDNEEGRGGGIASPPEGLTTITETEQTRNTSFSHGEKAVVQLPTQQDKNISKIEIRHAISGKRIYSGPPSFSGRLPAGVYLVIAFDIDGKSKQWMLSVAKSRPFSFRMKG